MKLIDQFTIIGRGLTLVVELDETDTVKINDIIPHDGKLFQVVAIEIATQMMYPPKQSNVVALTVRGVIKNE